MSVSQSVVTEDCLKLNVKVRVFWCILCRPDNPFSSYIIVGIAVVAVKTNGCFESVCVSNQRVRFEPEFLHGGGTAFCVGRDEVEAGFAVVNF